MRLFHGRHRRHLHAFIIITRNARGPPLTEISYTSPGRLCACSGKTRVRLPLGACAIDCTLDRRSRKLASSLSSRLISRTQSFQEKRPIKIKDLSTLKRFVAVIGRPVPCTARLASRRTDRQTDQVHTYQLSRFYRDYPGK